jgi:hypothetical protein
MNTFTLSSQAKKYAVLAVLLFAGTVGAEPYIAVRTGFKCSQCHLNKVGGGGRTEYGQAYTQYKLLMQQTQGYVDSKTGGSLSSFSPKLNDAVTIGANFRMEQSVASSQATLPSEKTLANPEANLYVNVELIKNFLSFYTDQNLTGGNRETWMMVRNLPLNSYVRVGKTLLPYGIRLVDDDAFIRTNVGYTYGNPDIAGEVGLEPGPFSAIVNATNSRLSGVGSITYRHFRVGGSYRTSLKNAQTQQFDAYGPFVGANYGRITVMAEVDWIDRADLRSDTLPNLKQMAHFYEVNFLAMQGLNLKGTYEYFDRNTEVANRRDGQSRITTGVEVFPIQFIQLGLYYRYNKSIPQNDLENQDQIFGRALIFF